MREKSQHHGRPAQTKFGQRVIKDQLGEHKAEQRVVDSVKQMKAEGLSLRAIARCLDLMKVATKMRGRNGILKWLKEYWTMNKNEKFHKCAYLQLPP